MPTVQGMFRRGLQLAALKEFILAQGASKNVTLQASSPVLADSDAADWLRFRRYALPTQSHSLIPRE